MTGLPFRIHFLVSAVLTAVLILFNSVQHATSFILGAGLISLNWLALEYVWSRLLAKKSIALAIGVIVIKWAFFGAICIGVVRLRGVDATWLILGISTIIPTVLIMAVKK